MSRLLLLRHAKAKWAEPGTRDFERDLDPSGRLDAAAMGAAMARAGYLPDRVLCSTAKRAVETWLAAAPGLRLAGSAARMAADLYSADAAGYLGIIRKAGDAQSLLVIGHNPMIEDVAMALATMGDDRDRFALSTGFPTAGLAVIRFDGTLEKAEPGSGFLEAFLTPSDL